MAPIANRILSEVMGLSAGDRGEIVARLLESLDLDVDHPDAEAAWDQEIRDRLEDVRSGHAVPVSWTDARKQIVDETNGEPS